MIDVDVYMADLCANKYALYQRYSDDILVVCQQSAEHSIVSGLHAIIKSHALVIKKEKTERVIFDVRHPKAFQYLGFNISPDAAVIRPTSLGRQWRKLKRSIRKTRYVGAKAILAGQSSKIYTKKLRKKFSPIGVRNFSLYARNSARAFQSPKILKQIRRFERAADDAIRDLNKQSE